MTSKIDMDMVDGLDDALSGLQSGITATGAKLARVANFQTGAVATGTTVIPQDDTIPQITEGTEFMTLAFTPSNAASVLIVECVVHLATSAAGGQMAAALFRDAVANALAVAYQWVNVANAQACIKITHKMTAGQTTPITFRVRGGQANAGTTTFNGGGGLRQYGGALASSITVTEYPPQ